MRPPTEKQLKLIAKMEQYLDVAFGGTSVTEASAFISKHMKAYQEYQEFLFDMVYYEEAY